MKPARSRTSRPATRAQRFLMQMAPVISSVLMGMSCVAGGAGLVASILEENGLGLALSATLLVVAAELYVSSRPHEA